MKKRWLHSSVWMMACILFAACDGLPKKSNAWNPYEIHPTTTPTGHAIPADNDIYYTKPGSYSGCATINDAPSCVGG